MTSTLASAPATAGAPSDGAAPSGRLLCLQCRCVAGVRRGVGPRLRLLLRPPRGALRLRPPGAHRDAGVDRPGAAEHLALRRPPAPGGPVPGGHRLAGLPPAPAPNLGRALGLRDLWIKNDSVNPTFSFKDRVVAVASAKAREFGFDTFACASTGNLASAVAAGLRVGLKTFVFLPGTPSSPRS